MRLRRTISLRKDEYTLDRKHVTKTEVVNLLESAGFSRANPYYIVQQGKIRDLAVMTDKARLELLKEVGGTKVYEERRKESLLLMKDAAAKKTEISDMLQFFEDKVKYGSGELRTRTQSRRFSNTLTDLPRARAPVFANFTGMSDRYLVIF